jgi:hypothetical protein
MDGGKQSIFLRGYFPSVSAVDFLNTVSAFVQILDMIDLGHLKHFLYSFAFGGA